MSTITVQLNADAGVNVVQSYHVVKGSFVGRGGGLFSGGALPIDSCGDTLV